MFVIMMALYVEKHQNFAKQVTVSSLLVFATISVQLKMPKEGTSENHVINFVDKLGFLNFLTYFELNYLVKNAIYPNLYHMALHMSRLIDVAPEHLLRNMLQISQREMSKSLVICELISDTMKRLEKTLEPQDKGIVEEPNLLADPNLLAEVPN